MVPSYMTLVTLASLARDYTQQQRPAESRDSRLGHHRPHTRVEHMKCLPGVGIEALRLLGSAQGRRSQERSWAPQRDEGVGK